MPTKLASLTSSALLVLSMLATPAFTAGDGGGGGGNTTCPKGKVLDKATNTCKDAARGAVDDDSLYEYGRALAHEGRYGEAITILGLASDKADPRILNYLGYSHRKAGRVLVGLGYYQEALRQDPNYTLVREYMGEAYLQQGNVDAARGQLVEIGKRCGKDCREYALLSEQIDAYVKG
jgi:tetratricopeptide (TPR) repeat protein